MVSEWIRKKNTKFSLKHGLREQSFSTNKNQPRLHQSYPHNNKKVLNTLEKIMGEI